jgi:hypothetical protein
LARSPSLLRNREILDDHAAIYGGGDHGTARQLVDEQGPGWSAITVEEQVGKDTAELRYWQELALRELETEEPTVLEVEASAPKTVRLD